MNLDNKPTYDDLVRRLDALEKRTLAVDDLPLAQLQRRLEQQWLASAVNAVAPPEPMQSWAGIGAWGSGAVTPTSGVVLCSLTNAKRGLLIASATGYVAAAATALNVEVYLNGTLVGTLSSLPSNPVNTRITLPTGVWVANYQAGTNYLNYRLASGSSDANDRGYAAAIF